MAVGGLGRAAVMVGCVIAALAAGTTAWSSAAPHRTRPAPPAPVWLTVAQAEPEATPAATPATVPLTASTAAVPTPTQPVPQPPTPQPPAAQLPTPQQPPPGQPAYPTGVDTTQPLPLAIASAELVTVPTTGSMAVPAVRVSAGQFRPHRLLVPGIGVDAEVVSIGMTDDLALQVPDDPAVLGWWNGGAGPAAGTGTVTVTGHVSWAGTPGALRHLAELPPGESAWLIGADGAGIRYVSERVETYLKTALPSQDIFATAVPERLVLITCGGAFDPFTGRHDSNVVAYLSRESVP